MSKKEAIIWAIFSIFGVVLSVIIIAFNIIPIELIVIGILFYISAILTIHWLETKDLNNRIRKWLQM